MAARLKTFDIFSIGKHERLEHTSTMEDAIDALKALTNRYDEPDIQDRLQRLSDDQGSQDIEEWAKKLYIAKRDSTDARATALNNDRKVVLKLVYDVVDLWNKVQDNHGIEAAAEFEDSILDIFKARRLERILGFGVVMDRAQALYAMKIPTSSKYGMHWYSKFHFENDSPYCNYDYAGENPEEEQEWRELLADYPGRPTMNRRLFQLLYSEKLGLQRRFSDTFATWSKPQAAEFVDIRAHT